MAKSRVSAGLLMYRRDEGGLQVLLVHPGGPFFRDKDEGAWSIPKGEVGPGEEPLDAAVREFAEETGTAPTGPYLSLAPVEQKGGKTVHAWAFEGDCDPAAASPSFDKSSIDPPTTAPTRRNSCHPGSVSRNRAKDPPAPTGQLIW